MNNELWGYLKIWGTDENGYWEHKRPCYQSEVHEILEKYDREFEDYDFFEA